MRLGGSITTHAEDHAAGWRIDWHSHDEAQLIYARSGVMLVSLDRERWVLPPQRALWVPPERAHAIDCRTALSLRTLYLSGQAAAALPDCRVVSVSTLLSVLVLRLVEGPLVAGQRDLIESLILSELVATEVEPLRLPQPTDPRLLVISEAWSHDPADPRGLTEWASMLALSERSLIRVIAKDCGMTFRQWRRQVRLLAALEGLARGHQVTTVALDCGYQNLSAFVQSFRATFGITPGRYFQGQETKLRNDS
ncbi:MAG: helix-turn-helix transcriptional regulator [Pseudomonadota bacterium]